MKDIKTLSLILILLVISNTTYSQTNKNDWSLRISAGANEQPYFEKIWGHYLKAGVKYSVFKNLSLILSHEMSESDNFPSDFKFFYNNPNYGDEAFLNRFKGISRSDWYSGKADLTSNSNSIYILQGAYDFYFGKKKLFLLCPKFGYSYVKSNYFLINLQEVSFENDALVYGRVVNESKILSLWGFHYGIEFAKKIGEKSKLFLEINKTADQTGGPNTWEFFEAFTIGVGYEIKINSSKK